MAMFLGSVCMWEGKVRYCRGMKGLFSPLYAGINKYKTTWFHYSVAAGLRTPLAVPGPYPAPFGMVPHAGMNGELTSPGAAYASLHNMSPQMSAAAAAAAVVAYGRSPMVGHTLHAISVVWVVVHWEELHASFSTVEFPSYNSARGLTASLCVSLCCVAGETNLHLENKESWCIYVCFLFSSPSSVLWLINKCQKIILCIKLKGSFGSYKIFSLVLWTSAFLLLNQISVLYRHKKIHLEACRSLFIYISVLVFWFLWKSIWESSWYISWSSVIRCVKNSCCCGCGK